ncbi:MAG: hypothetical protein NWF06_06065, partial [Candidatus Bathyarchaeota archaeon]|nr:hypothetical protein [Candidatus Bathyarchaeum sp.]
NQSYSRKGRTNPNWKHHLLSSALTVEATNTGKTAFATLNGEMFNDIFVGPVATGLVKLV